MGVGKAQRVHRQDRQDREEHQPRPQGRGEVRGIDVIKAHHRQKDLECKGVDAGDVFFPDQANPLGGIARGGDEEDREDGPDTNLKAVHGFSFPEMMMGVAKCS